MLSLQVVSPSPTYFLFHFNFNLNSNPILIPHSRCSLLARCLPRFPLALELDVPVGSISRSPPVCSLQSAVFCLPGASNLLSAFCIVYSLFNQQSALVLARCICFASQSRCLTLPDQAFNRAHTISFFQCSLPCVRCNVCFCLFESQLKLFCTISARSSNLIGVWPLQL